MDAAYCGTGILAGDGRRPMLLRRQPAEGKADGLAKMQRRPSGESLRQFFFVFLPRSIARGHSSGTHAHSFSPLQHGVGA